MAFTQIDENTVQDEEGHKYFTPFLNFNANAVQAPDVPATVTDPEKPSETKIQQDPEGLPDLASLRNPPSFAGLPSGTGTSTPTTEAAPPDYKLTAPSVAATKQSPEAARNGSMSSDVTAFSQAGGVAKTDEDYARILGGHASHEAETAKAKAESDKLLAAGNLEKTKVMAGMMVDTAKEYEDHVNKIMQDSQSRFTDWKKRNDEASNRLIDPNHAFTHMSTASKAGWIMQFLGAGMQGGNQVGNVTAALNKLIDQDISAQKFNIENKREGLNAEKGMIVEQDRMSKDSVASWYSARQLRLTAVGRQLDAKIAEMGMPAAQAANLLAARDAIEKEIIKGQEHIGNHFFEDGQRRGKEAHDIYLERLKSKLRMTEDAYKEQLKKGTDKNDTLPTNTQLGLQMVDKATGKIQEGGKVRLKVKGEKAVEAGQVLSTANEEASQLRDVQSHLSKMSSSDLARGGTPEFKSMVKDLIQTRAVRDNGHRLSDDDVVRAAQEEFGVSMKDSLAANSAESMRLVGPYKDGVVKAIESQLRNLSTRTTNKLHPYIDSDDAEKYDIQYNVQGTHVPEVSDKPDDLNTAITKAASGGNVDDVLVPGPRKPVVAGEPRAATETSAEYKAEKEIGRGLQGGLPVLPQKEEDAVNHAAADFSKATGEEILRLATAYLRTPGLSEEAKHEISLEADLAQAEAKEKEQAVIVEATGRYLRDNFKYLPDEKEQGTYRPIAPKDVKDTSEFKKYLDSGLVDEMRRRAGLEPRKK